MLSVPQPINEALNELESKYELSLSPRQGSNSFVFFGTHKVLGRRCAIKFYYWGGGSHSHLEPQALVGLQSPYILSIFDAGYAGDEWAYFVTPLCPDGDLDLLLKAEPIGNHRAVDLLSNILSGLSVLHGSRYVHRDLKPANIYLDGPIAVIGDFGSVGLLPVGVDQIPASRHAALYRPPESILTNSYGTRGDIYQCGFVLYQLLGGSLPYEEIAWLNNRDLEHYKTLTFPETTLFADQCLKQRIIKGRVLDLRTINPWVPNGLKRVIRKACRLNPNERFSSAADVLAVLMTEKQRLCDWRDEGDAIVLHADTSYRVSKSRPFVIEKRRSSAEWRRDNSLPQTLDLRSLIQQIERRVR